MATVRQLAQRLASQGVTRERFVELMSSFGIDPLDPASQDVEVGEQFASAPLMPGEGPQRGAPLTFEQPAVFGFQPEPATGMRPPPQRPLPYATDVQRPFEAAPGQAALRNQPRELAPSAVSEQLIKYGRPETSSPAYYGTGTLEDVARYGFEPLPTTVGLEEVRSKPDTPFVSAVKGVLAPEEDPGFELARELQSGLNPYQKAAFGDIPEVASARGQAAITRLSALPGVAAGAATSYALEGIKAVRPDEWQSDEDMSVAGITLSPEERRGWDRRFAEEDMASVDLLDEIVSDSIMRSETSTFAQNAVRSALEFTEATFELLSWMSGGNIPKAFWENSTEADRKKVIADIVGPELFPEISTPFKESDALAERRQDILLGEAVDRWPQFGREMVAFLSALFNNPYAVSHAHPIPVAAMVYPLARKAGIKLGSKASEVGSRVQSALDKFADEPVAPKQPLGSSVRPFLEKGARKTAGSIAAFNELIADVSSAFQRWKIDPTLVADPAMRPMAEQIIRGASDVEAGVATLGGMLERAVRPPGDELAPRARRLSEPTPEGPPPLGEGFTFRDVPGDELPEVASIRQAMEARRAGPPPEQPVVGETLALPAPGQVPPRVGKYSLSPDAEAFGLRLLDMDSPLLKQMAESAFKGRTPTQLDRAALAEAFAYLIDSTRNIATPQSRRAALIQRMRDAGGDPFLAAERAFRAQETAAGGPAVGVREVVSPELAEPVPDLPQVAQIRRQIEARRQAPPPQEAVTPPDVAAATQWQRARAAVSEAQQSSKGLYERLDAARAEGLHKTNPAEYARMYDEAINTSHALEMQAQRAVDAAKAAQAKATPPQVPRSRALIPIEEVVTPEVIDIPTPKYEVVPWQRPGRAAYEAPSLSPGLRPPPPGRKFGYEFEQKLYSLKGKANQPRTLSPAREMTPEGLTDVAPVVRTVTPVAQRMNPEVFRIIEDAAEWFEGGPLRNVPGFREMILNEYQAALDTRIANILQVKAAREGAVKLVTSELARRGRVKVDPKSVLSVLDEAKEGRINDVGIQYKDWQTGEPRVLSVVDVLSKSLEFDPQFKDIVVSSMLNANMHRAATRARKLVHLNTMGKTIREWHPRHSTYEVASVDPAKGLVQMESAVKRRPPIDAELDFFKYRYEREGALPPITRNAPEAIIKYAEDNGIQLPGALRRRLVRMEKVSEPMLDALGLRRPDGVTSARDVRISPMILDEGMPPELYVKGDILSSMKFVFTDRAWADSPLPILYGHTVQNLFAGLSQGIKKGRVALNPSSLQAAGAANTMAASLKWGDPFALPKMVDWWLDMARYNKGLPTKRPKSHFEALLQSSDILDSSFTFELGNNKNLLDIKAGDSFVQRLVKRGNRAYDMPVDFLSRMFDKPDNVAKGWETMKKADKYLSDIAMLPEGKSIGVPMGRGVDVVLTKKATSERGKVGVLKDGKQQLTEPQLIRILTKSAAEDAARTYVNFRNVPLAQVAKRNIPLWDAIFGSPFSGWQSVTTTLPGRQGIVGEILSGPVNRGWTDYVPLMVKRQAESAVHGAKIGSVIGSQAAQLDENSELFRLASVWGLDRSDTGLDEVKPVLISPTDNPQVYDVWKIGTSDPLEDLATTIRMISSATSPLEALSFIDPAAVSTLGERGFELSKATPEEISKMSTYERRMYNASKGLSSPRLRAMGSPIKRALDSFYLGGSAIADIYMSFVKGKGVPKGELDIPAMIAFGVKTSLRSYIPAYAGKTASAYAESIIPEIKAKIAALSTDETIPDLERDEMIAEARKELEYAKYFAGQKLVESKPLEDGGVFDRASKDFTSIIMDHWFNLPRPELMLGNESKAQQLFKRMKSEALKAAGAASKAQIDEQEKLVKEARARFLALPSGSEEKRMASKQVAAMQGIVNRMKSEAAALKNIISVEFDARARVVNKQTRNQKAIGKGLKRYMKDGRRVLNRSQRTKGKEYVRKRYEQLDKELFPPEF